jgi:hypothetical protein
VFVVENIHAGRVDCLETSPPVSVDIARPSRRHSQVRASYDNNANKEIDLWNVC